MKVAIVGSGISGLAVAHTLRDQADLTRSRPVITSAATRTPWT